MAGTPGGGSLTKTEKTDLAVLAVIVLVGAYVRLHDLGVPSLWWDEIIVPLMARFPATTILRWSSIYEPNPPLYHLLTKVTVWLGGSNTILRLPGALMGVGTIVLLYFFCSQCFSRRAGLACAALLAVNPLHILMSRQLRPYTAVIFILLCSLIMLIRYALSGRLKDLAALAVLNALAVSLHYNAVLFMAAQAFWLWGLSLFSLSKQNLEMAWWHSVSLVVSFLTVSYFFFSTVFSRQDMIGARVSFVKLIDKIPVFIREMAFGFDGFVPGHGNILIALAVLLFLLGIRKAFAVNARASALLCVNVVAPLALVVFGKSNFLFARYLFFVYVSILMFQGVGLAWLCKERVQLVQAMALVLMLVCGWYIPHHYQKSLYLADSYMVYGPGGSYEEDFRVLSEESRERRFEVFEDEGLRQAFRWYETHGLAAGPGDAQVIKPEDKQTVLTLVITGGRAHPQGGNGGLLRRMGSPDEIKTSHGLEKYSWTVGRNAVHNINVEDKYYEFSADPWDFISNVYSSHHVQILPVWGNSVIPTANDQDGEFEYRFNCPYGVWFGQVYLELHLKNVGQNGVLKAFARFDEEELYIFGSRGPDSRSLIKIPIFHDKPYKNFSLRVQMNCAPDSPNYPGSNLDLIGFKKFVVGFLCPRGCNKQ